MSDFKCNNNCAKFHGNCRNHFEDSNGHIVWDCPSESMYDGIIGDVPKCFVPSEEYKEKQKKFLIEEVARTYSIDILKAALELKEQEWRL